MVFIKCLVFYTISVLAHQGEKDFDQMTRELTKNLDAPQVSSTLLKKSLTKKIKSDSFLILDAREKAEFSVSHIPTALRIGFKDFKLEETLKKIPKNQKVVVYCSVGYRSGKIVEKLRKKGVDAYNLKGGVFGWANKGNSLVNEKKQSTKKVHGYNKAWSKWIRVGDSVLLF